MDLIDMLVDDIVKAAERRFAGWPFRDEDAATLIHCAALRLMRHAEALAPRGRRLPVLSEAETRQWVRQVFRHALRPPDDDERPKQPDPPPTGRVRELEGA